MFSVGDGTFEDHGNILTNWCGDKGESISYSDVNGNGMVDLLCSDSKGNHWAKINISGDLNSLIDIGKFRSGFCFHLSGRTHWADINGDGVADMICDDFEANGNHWAILSEKIKSKPK